MQSAWLNGMLCMIGFNDPKKFPKSFRDILNPKPKAMNAAQWKAMIQMVVDSRPAKKAA